MLRGSSLEWQRMVDSFEPTVTEVEQIQGEIGGTILAEVYTAPFFSSVKGQAKAYESDNSVELSNAYSILQPPGQRTKLMEFLTLMKPKMADGQWIQLSKRLRSDSRLQSMQGLFEVTIAGNLMAQLPNDSVQLNVLTVNGRDADIGVLLDERIVHLEVTVLDESKEMKERRPMMEKQKYPIWTPSLSEIDGTPLFTAIDGKSKDFKSNHPNALAIQIFSMYDWGPIAQENYGEYQPCNIGLLLPFGRIELKKEYVKQADDSCALTESEQDMLTNLLSGDDFFPLGYI